MLKLLRRVNRWLGPYLMAAPTRRPPRRDEEVHLLLCVADHYEPKQNRPAAEVSRRRVERWVRDYPRQFGRFRDGDGRTPRHTFFYPAEEYEPEYLDALAGLCRDGFGEVEVHLHHDDDTADNLRATLRGFTDVLSRRHGLLGRRRPLTPDPSPPGGEGSGLSPLSPRGRGVGGEGGDLAYGFIHGNWALCNSRPDGRFCGVNSELTVLRETGCYADFTLPSAPSPTQTPTINRIYYARDIPGRPRSHDRGVDVGAWHGQLAAHGTRPEGALMLIQGPLLLNWRSRKYGLLPRLENGCIQNSQPAVDARIDLWLRARVQVPTRPDWFFVKLHAHGAHEDSHEALLGEPMVRFHEALARRARENPRFHFHYVTAREMYNLARAAEAGWTGPIAGALDYEVVSNVRGPCAPTPLLEEMKNDRTTERGTGNDFHSSFPVPRSVVLSFPPGQER